MQYSQLLRLVVDRVEGDTLVVVVTVVTVVLVACFLGLRCLLFLCLNLYFLVRRIFFPPVVFIVMVVVVNDVVVELSTAGFTKLDVCVVAVEVRAMVDDVIILVVAIGVVAEVVIDGEVKSVKDEEIVTKTVAIVVVVVVVVIVVVVVVVIVVGVVVVIVVVVVVVIMVVVVVADNITYMEKEEIGHVRRMYISKFSAIQSRFSATII